MRCQALAVLGHHAWVIKPHPTNHTLEIVCSSCGTIED